jgi:hypothetical protein
MVSPEVQACSQTNSAPAFEYFGKTASVGSTHTSEIVDRLGKADKSATWGRQSW